MISFGKIKETDHKGIAKVLQEGEERSLALCHIGGSVSRPKGQNCIVMKMADQRDIAVVINNERYELQENDFVFDFGNVKIKIDAKDNKATLEVKDLELSVENLVLKAKKEIVLDANKTTIKGSELNVSTDKIGMEASVSVKTSTNKFTVDGDLTVTKKLLNGFVDVGATHIHTLDIPPGKTGLIIPK